MKLIEAVDISKRYGGLWALKNFSLSISQGSVFGILGPNGAGKTSFIRIITQILAPDEGQILFKGAPIAANDASKTGYLPEERGLYKKMTIEAQLIYLAGLKGIKRSVAKERIKILLQKFDLEQWRNRAVEELSKGMQQKVQFMSSIVHQPELLILDEPFSGFDPLNADILKNEILEIKKSGCTIIYSTHRMETVEELCDEIVLINKGEKLLEGKVAQIRQENKKNIYSLEMDGLPEANGSFSITESIGLDNGRYNLKIKTEKAPNEVIKSLLPYGQIHCFKEELPSINDIFISKIRQS